MDSSPILIVGSGAMACLFAARLTLAGQQVCMVDTWETGIREIKENGVTLYSGDKKQQQNINAFYHSELITRCRYALVLVKSWQTPWAAAFLADHLTPNGQVITLQNGMGNAEIIESHLSKKQVAIGTTTLGGTLLSPGIVEGFVDGDLTIQDVPDFKDFFERFTSANLKLNLNSHIEQIIWGKLMVNAAINPLTALLEVRNGKLLEIPSAMQMIHLLINEAMQVAARSAVTLPYADPMHEIKSVLITTAGNYSSMYQDIQRGAPTEIEQINGAIVRLGQANDVPTPYNESITTLIKGKVEKNKL